MVILRRIIAAKGARQVFNIKSGTRFCIPAVLQEDKGATRLQSSGQKCLSGFVCDMNKARTRE